MTLLSILTEQCATCIFRPGNLMHLQRGRVADMVNECHDQQSHIVCHETMVWCDDDGNDDDGNATGPVCRGFYDRYPHVSQLIRIAERLDAVTFVAPPTEGSE